MKLIKALIGVTCLGLITCSSVLATDRQKKEIDKDIEKFSSKLISNYKLDDNRKKQIIEIFSKARKEFNSYYKAYLYSDYYTRLIVENHIEDYDAISMMNVFKEEMESGRDFYYSYYYAILRIIKKLDESEARKRVIEKGIYKKKVIDDNSEIYIDYYMYYLLREIEDEEAMKLAKASELARRWGMSRKGSEFYAYVSVFSGLNGKELVKKLNKLKDEVNDKNNEYMCYYIYSLMKGNSKEMARIQADIYEKGIISGKSHKVSKKIAIKESYKRKAYEEKKKEKGEKEARIYAEYYSKVKANEILRR